MSEGKRSLCMLLSEMKKDETKAPNDYDDILIAASRAPEITKAELTHLTGVIDGIKNDENRHERIVDILHRKYCGGGP